MIIRIRGVKTVTSKGRVYYYHRKTMTPLPGFPGSTEFMDKLSALQRAKGKKTTLPVTLGDLISKYRASPEFTRLAPNSKRQYNTRFDRLKLFAGTPLVAITSRRIYDLRDKLNEKYSRSAANTTVAMLNIIFAWAVKRDIMKDNPAAKVDRIRRPKDAPIVNRRWRDSEVATVLAAAPPWLRVAVALAAYTGLRLSDVAAVTWDSYDGEAFEARQIKTGQPVWIPAHRELRAILDALPRADARIVVGVRGKPMRGEDLGSRFSHFIASLEAAGTVAAGLTFHGLRHTLATRLAEAGCDPATIAAVTGHASARMTETYTRDANRRKLAREAFDRLESGE